MVIRNVNDLRKYLDELEANWTDQDCHYLGEFGYQKITAPHFLFDVKGGEIIMEFRGYGTTEIHYDGGLGFIIQQENPHESD